MLTASLYSVPVAATVRPYDEADTAHQLARIASEVAERLEEMDELKRNSGADLVCRMASVAQLDRGAFRILVAVLHGRTECLLDSYAAQGEAKGRDKQVIHYRTRQHLATLQTAFPEIAAVIEAIRTSVEHHEERQSKADVLRGATQQDD